MTNKVKEFLINDEPLTSSTKKLLSIALLIVAVVLSLKTY